MPAFERTTVALDPITLLMFGLIAVLIFFMFRNGKKRQAAMQELQNSLRPGAEVMLQSGIFATIVSIDDEENRATVRSGDSTFIVHRSAIGQVVKPVEAPAEDEGAQLAPDDDPEFGERIAKDQAENAQDAEGAATEGNADGQAEGENGSEQPKA